MEDMEPVGAADPGPIIDVQATPVQPAAPAVAPASNIVPMPGHSLTVPTFQLSPAQRDLMRRTFFNDCNEDEFVMAVMFCERTQLDPMTGQVHFIERTDTKLGRKVRKPQVSIDGFRLIAQRTGDYQGQRGPYWCGPDGEWTDVWLSEDPPVAARVGVLRAGFVEPLWGTAHWKSYRQTDRHGTLTKFWRDMPEVMIAKVAEALALRRAFPHELGGVYTPDEMAQSENGDEERFERAKPAGQPHGGKHQRRHEGASKRSEREPPKHLVKLVEQAMTEAGIARKALPEFIAKHFNGRSFGQLSDKELNQLVVKLKAEKRRGGGRAADDRSPPGDDRQN